MSLIYNEEHLWELEIESSYLWLQSIFLLEVKISPSVKEIPFPITVHEGWDRIFLLLLKSMIR